MKNTYYKSDMEHVLVQFNLLFQVSQETLQVSTKTTSRITDVILKHLYRTITDLRGIVGMAL